MRCDRSGPRSCLRRRRCVVSASIIFRHMKFVAVFVCITSRALCTCSRDVHVVLAHAHALKPAAERCSSAPGFAFGGGHGLVLLLLTPAPLRLLLFIRCHFQRTTDWRNIDPPM